MIISQMIHQAILSCVAISTCLGIVTGLVKHYFPRPILTDFKIPKPYSIQLTVKFLLLPQQATIDRLTSIIRRGLTKERVDALILTITDRDKALTQETSVTTTTDSDE